MPAFMLACLHAQEDAAGMTSLLTVATVNLKGGVGKTSVTLGIADAAAQIYAQLQPEAPRRVLVVDIDPQANATEELLPDFDEDEEIGLNQVMLTDHVGGITTVIRPTSWAGVDVAPGSLDLANREMATGATAQLMLRRVMYGLDSHTSELAPAGYGLVLIDCNPSIGNLTVNALVASMFALIVAEPERRSLRGIDRTLKNIEKTRGGPEGGLNPDLRLAGIIPNNYDAREADQVYRLNELIETHGERIWEPALLHRAVVRTASSAGVPVRLLKEPAAAPVAANYALHAQRLLALTPGSELRP